MATNPSCLIEPRSTASTKQSLPTTGRSHRHLTTFGSESSATWKSSQSFQLDVTSAKKLVAIIEATFGKEVSKSRDCGCGAGNTEDVLCRNGDKPKRPGRPPCRVIRPRCPRPSDRAAHRLHQQSAGVTVCGLDDPIPAIRAPQAELAF